MANTPAFFDAQSARQLFARQLYVLALLVTELVDRNGDGDVTNTTIFPTLPIQLLGQLGIDSPTAAGHCAMGHQRRRFPDPDSIMTPFEVDLNPFDGWDVDGDLNTNEVANGRYLHNFISVSGEPNDPSC